MSGLNVPPEFKVDITADTAVPLVSEEVYRVGVHMMYDVSGFPLMHPWLARSWFSGPGNTGIHVESNDFGGKSPSRLSTQQVIWGLNHLILSMTLSERYCQTVAVLKWEGVTIGAIHVARRTKPGMDSDPESRNNILQLAQEANRPLGAEDDIEVTISYAGSMPIDRRIIFLTAIRAMGDAAEKGMDRPVISMITQGLQRVSWKLASGSAAFTGVFRPGQSRIAVVKAVAKMIEDRRFQKTIVWVKVDGQNTAAGGFFQG
ncbi:MAG: hypothetical protein Q9188_006121 [Gyalolechia gomerana]